MRAISTAQLASEYTAGASLLALARQHDICHSAILYRLRRFGVTMRRQGAPDGNQHARASWSTRASDPPPPSPGGKPIPGDEEYED